METEILKLILRNQGSVDTEELLCNLCDLSFLTDLISKNDKFVSCLLSPRPKVVVRSRLTLCWGKECAGSCGRLHLCLRFLLGTCKRRKGCSFSHELHSEHNLEVLRRSGLESLNRTELCLLLLQSNSTLLPQICPNYNNRVGCQDDCKRLHVCQRFLNHDCSCPRTHDFSAPQPLRILQEKYIPDQLIKVLKSVYANIEALRLAKKGKGASNNQNELNDAGDSDSSSTKQTGGRKKRGGRGRRGRGQTGAHGGQKQQDRAPSSGETEDNANTEETGNDSSQEQSSTENDDYESDSSSTIGTGSGKDCSGTKARGRGGYRGNRGHKKGTGTRQAAANFDGFTNESEESGRGNAAKVRGNSRGGRGNRGHRGGRSNKAEGASSRRDFQEDDNDDTDVKSSQDRTASGDEANDGKQESSFGGGSREKTSFQPPHRASPFKNADGSSAGPQRRQRDKTEICMFFIKGHCIHEDRCFKAHDKMPYRWEIKQGAQWTPMAENETIEKDYCNPENTYSTTSPPVHFDTMKCKSDEVRRLSTLNSVLEPDFIHTTDWLWYWEDEYGKWYEYAAVTSEHRLASITSKDLEEMYVKNNKDVVTFTAGSQSYELSFKDMIQTNLNYSTKKLVRRRPRFVSAAEVQTKRKRAPHSTAVPDSWDKTQIPQIGFKRVALQPSSGEFKEVQGLFSQTMAAFEILRIERIQNKAVWEAFQLHKTHMKHKNGGRLVLEKKLFHGTEPKFVDTICQTNFDWRVCGVNGTVYGQGSYFARDAKYSHDYTGDSDPRFMFVSRVLVGEFTKGSPEYRRPPSKDGGDVNLFDSCVNNVYNPSIFVVFEKQQIYPEYLLQYRHSGRSNVYAQSYSTSYRTVPPPASYTPSPARTNFRPAPAPAYYPPSPPTPPTPTDNRDSSCVIA